MAKPTDATRRANDAVLGALPFDDTQDFDDAQRGFIAALTPGVVTGPKGPVWDVDAYAFGREADVPETVNPSLWRQLRLLTIHGLFEVVPGIYQARGLDLSNVTFVEGTEGVIVIDPLISRETAAAALALYREHRGDRPVTAVIYTHSHVDHFGGVRGVVDAADVASGRVPIVAPAHFMERNVFLMGALELREGSKGTPVGTSTDLLGELSLDQLLDGIAIQIDGMRAASDHMVLNVAVEDSRAVVTLNDGGPHLRAGPPRRGRRRVDRGGSRGPGTRARRR